jgi:hypothetical protein
MPPPEDPVVRPGVARALNPEAGDHPVTADPVELAAAEEAGRRTLARYSYFTRRYGERGTRFTRSDSAWLAQLAGDEQERVTAQVLWLGRVLASRGIPRLLLEHHLLELAAALTQALPGRAAVYLRLWRAADRLATERAAHLDDAALEDLRAGFDDAVGAEWAGRHPRTGELLGAAVADARAGIPQALPALTSWLRDPERFPAEWIAAVDQTLARAEAVAR